MRARRTHSLGSLGVTPATDTSVPPPTTLNMKATAIGVGILALAIGGLVYLTEKER